MTALRPWRPQPTIRERLWPIRAVRDARQPPGREPDEFMRLTNMYPSEAEVGPLVVGRPGFALMGTVGLGAGVQLGSGGTRRVQLLHQFTERDGTEHTVCICGGQFYEYNWSTATWTETVTAANFTTASIAALSTTNRIYAVNFAGVMVVSDGAGVPWTWNGDAGAGGLVELVNAPVAFGQPVVYYGKVFFIKNAARETFVWSEEGDPATGYEAGGYNNAWDFVQTGSGPLIALGATNEALYVARANSLSAVSGAVSTDFQTTGTKNALSDGIGTRSPAAFLVVEDRVVFPDQYGAFQVARVGQGVREIADGSRNAMRSVPDTGLDDMQAVDDIESGHVKFWAPETGFDDPTMAIRIDRKSGRYAGRESGYQCTRVGVFKDASGVPTIAHGGGGNANAATTGYVYAHGHPDGTLWNDEFFDADAAIAHTIETPMVGNQTGEDKLFVRGEINLVPQTAVTSLTLTMTTPYGVSSSYALTPPSSGSGGAWDVDDWETMDWATEGEEVKLTWQQRERGRWQRTALTHAVLDERLAISELAIAYVPVSSRAEVL